MKLGVAAAAAGVLSQTLPAVLSEKQQQGISSSLPVVVGYGSNDEKQKRNGVVRAAASRKMELSSPSQTKTPHPRRAKILLSLFEKKQRHGRDDEGQYSKLKNTLPSTQAFFGRIHPAQVPCDPASIIIPC